MATPLQRAVVIAVLLLLGCEATVGQEGQKKTTLCEIVKNPAPYHGKIVQFRATFQNGLEFALLSVDGCPESIWLDVPPSEEPPGPIVFVPSSGGATAPPPAGERPVRLQRDREYEQFVSYASRFQEDCHTCPMYRITATFTGRLDYAGKLAALYHEGKQIGVVGPAGYGHMGLARIRLVLQSVKQVKAKQSPPR